MTSEHDVKTSWIIVNQHLTHGNQEANLLIGRITKKYWGFDRGLLDRREDILLLGSGALDLGGAGMFST
jgi:hypothetical protein